MKKILVIAIALILCLAVVGGVFALYKVEPNNKVLNITSGGTARLTISGFDDGGIKPGTPLTQQITLYDTIQQNLDGSGTFSITIEDVGTGELAQYLDVTWALTNSNFEQAGDSVSEADLIAGQQYQLTPLPIYGLLTVTCTANDEQFADVSGDQVTITLLWNYDAFEPVDGVWYLVGNNNGWNINSGAIALTDDLDGDNQAQKANVTLAAGSYKAIKYVANGDNVWASGDNVNVGAGTYNIGVNGSGNTWITAVNP